MLLCRILLVIGAAFALSACATIHNLPLNRPSANPFAGTLVQAAAAAEREQPRRAGNDSTVVGLAFSGGGTRAAAFAYGVLEQLRRTPGATPGAGRQSARSRQYRLRRVGRLDHRRIFRAEGPGRVGRFPPGIPRSRSDGGARHQHHPEQCRPRARRRRQHRQSIARLAQRPPLPRRDVWTIDCAPPHRADQCHRHLQPHAVSCSSRRPSRPCAATSANTRLPARSPPRRRCPVLSRRSSSKSFPKSCRTPLPEWVERASEQSGRVAAAACLRHGARARAHRQGEIRQAARRRPGRQLRAERHHHRACGGRYALRPVAAGGSRQAAATAFPGRGCRARPTRRLGADAGRADRRRISSTR